MFDRIPFSLCAYSVPHSMGYLPTRDGRFISTPVTPNAFVQRAADLGLSGVELPLMSSTPVFEGATVQTPSFHCDLRATLQELNLTLTADYGALLDYDLEHTRAYLAYAANCGAKVVRCIVSHVLCGDRRNLLPNHDAHMAALVHRISEILPAAADLGLSLAIENHQDLTSNDMISLYEATGCHPAFGITLDTGNPLAVGEDPVEFTRRVCPLIKHIHCKDYKVYFAPNGYRLVRCAVGCGAIDFAGILGEVRKGGLAIQPAIEMAAQATRTIPILEESWWEGYSINQMKCLPAALGVLWRHGKSETEPYSSLWECGAASESVERDEWDLVATSIDYCRDLARSVC